MVTKIISRFSLGILAVLLLGVFAIACGKAQAAPQPQKAAPAAQPLDASSLPQGAILPQDARRMGIDPTRHKAGEIASHTVKIARNPKDAMAYWGRAEALIEQGFIYNDKAPILQAIEDLTMSLQLDPNNWPRRYIDRGVAYTYLKDKTHAELDFAKARSLGVKQATIDDGLGNLAQYSRYWK